MRLARILIDERLVIGMILINSLALFMMQASDPGTTARQFWFFVDYACVFYFAVEQVLKLVLLGRRGYWASGWNRVDLLIVVASLPILFSPLVHMKQLSGILILRLGRLFRLFRLLRFVPDRDHVADGVIRALRASMGIFLAVVLINFILAMGACMLFGEFAPHYFGHPAQAFYSIFQVFTMDGWSEIPEAILAGSNSPGWAIFARIYMLGTVLVGGILGLSLANAVFVDQMMLDNTNSLNDRIDDVAETLEELRREIRNLGNMVSQERPPKSDGE